MSKKNIEKYIPRAMEVLKSTFENNVIPKEFNGYISSFGASIIQSELKSSIALFESKNHSTAQDKSCLIKIILKIIDTEEKSLLEYVIKYDNDSTKETILAISIAIKLSIRTFELKKGLKDVKC